MRAKNSHGGVMMGSKVDELLDPGPNEASKMTCRGGYKVILITRSRFCGHWGWSIDASDAVIVPA